ncbi:hypothetical protein D9756_006242 [Leucocoprinus leucothites]|uniref:Uncharacterized protein n=1 Tax=Leucocoprinus leucothites TaxID=201217 RepID=A0A8H5FWX1_9AGAR|nr:hypothetical protein D9756_006242 [Leucoagaricus leucothites]
MSTVRFDQQPHPLQNRTHSSDNNGRPKPCLKSLPTPELSPLPFSSYPLHSPHVHFPPTPTLTSTNFTHSAVHYDRAPIVVTENVCALPERGGRCYNTQPRNKRSRRPGGHGHSGSDVGISGIEVGPSASSSEPISSYFHPRAYEAVGPEPCLKDQQAQYNPYFSSYPPLSYSSSSSSSSSESESESDSFFGSLSPTSSPSIPRTMVGFGGAPSSAYPSDSSFISQQNGPHQSRQPTHASISRQPYQQPQQLSHNVHYPQPPSQGLAGCKPKKPASSGDGKVKSSRRGSSTSPAARLTRFSGGFSDQSMVLDGCLGGF